MFFKLNFFFKELLLFGATLVVGIFSASKAILYLNEGVVEPIKFSVYDLIALVIFFIFFSLLMTKIKKVVGVSMHLFLIIIIFAGSQIILETFVTPSLGLILAFLFTILFVKVKNVLMHNLGIIIGIAGVASVLGISISPKTGVFLLVGFSFYDVVAVYWTRHMVHMAKGMIESGAIFGFIIPFKFRDFLSHKRYAQGNVGQNFMILGSGDIGLPLVLVSSLAVVSLYQAVVTSVFACIGLFIMHLIFINQKKKKPMAALPPIATMTIIGYLVSLL